ncbi:hypothetical protein ABW19_dt0202834 [Dactylella cylindrospora]|nr:hypothetical protein ABW19_dt0202834 [Dactylella cylindrospora]
MKRQSTDNGELNGTQDSVRGKKRKVVQETPPLGIGIYTRDTIPWDLLNYWNQRYSLFSLWDEGIWITDEGYYSVTPESVAKKIARHVLPTSISKPQVIIDAFCGVGGNAIQFALSPQCEKVIAIDCDEKMLACAKHNARIYGVEEKIEFIHKDYFEFCEEWEGDVEVGTIFLSPPWGGPGYKYDKVFDLETMTYGGERIYKAARKVSPNVVLYLPRNSDLNQIARYDPTNKNIKVIHYCIQSRSKALCAFFGDAGSEIKE